MGQLLEASTASSAIQDTDGLSNLSWGYQWIRVDGGTGTGIGGATEISYKLVTAHAG